MHRRYIAFFMHGVPNFSLLHQRLLCILPEHTKLHGRFNSVILPWRCTCPEKECYSNFHGYTCQLGHGSIEQCFIQIIGSSYSFREDKRTFLWKKFNVSKFKLSRQTYRASITLCRSIFVGKIITLAVEILP